MSELKILKIEEATPSQWDNIVDHCDYATYFHSREWANLWEQYSDGEQKASARFITFSDGTEVLFPMSISKVSKGLLLQHVSTPTWTYGGWLSLQKLSLQHHQLLSDYTSKLDIIMRQNPFDTSLPADAFPWSDNDFTQVLDISVGLPELHRIWAKHDNDVVHCSNKARRSGIVVTEATSIDDWRTYFKMYEAAQRRWTEVLGLRFSWKLFELIYNMKSPHIRLWVSRYEGKPVSGLICTYQNKHVAGWHAASFQEYFKFRPVDLQYYEVIVRSCQEGYNWFDFLTSAELKGVIAFKAKFGAEKLTTNLLLNKRFLRRAIDNAKEIVCQAQLQVKKQQAQLTSKLKV